MVAEVEGGAREFIGNNMLLFIIFDFSKVQIY